MPSISAGRSMLRPYETGDNGAGVASILRTCRIAVNGSRGLQSVRLGRRYSRADHGDHPYCVAERVADVGGHLVEVGDG